MGLTPRQQLEDFIESGDTKTWPDATPWVARIEMIAALSALHIGDGLREIAQAINGAVNPTDADLDKRLEQAAQLTERALANLEQLKPGS